LKFHLRGAAILLAAGFLLQACSSGEENESNALRAPAFALSAIGGDRTVSLSDFRGKVLILDFWATWCPPCKREIPHFNDLYEKYRSEGLEILGVSVDQGGAEVVTRYMESSAPSLTPQYPVVIADRQVQASYGPIASIPTTFVIDRKGNVQQKIVGYREREVFASIIEELL